MFINKSLRLINLKTRAAVNAKISMSLICVEAIIYLLSYNLYDCTVKSLNHFWPMLPFYAPETPEKFWFIGVFREYKVETLARNGLKEAEYVHEM